MGKRNLYWDTVKGLLITLVVLGHFLQLSESRISNSFVNLIYSFHMPLFVFVSGYFTNVDSTRFGKRLVKQVETFLVFQLFFTFALFSNLDLRTFFEPRFALWYLLSMIYWKIAIYLLLKNNEINKNYLYISIVLALVSGFVPQSTLLSFQRTFAFFPFFLAGVLCRNVDFEQQLSKINKFIPIIIIAGLFGYFYYDSGSYLMLFANSVHYLSPFYNRLCERLISIIIGGLVSLSVLRLLKPVNFIAEIGKASLFIYIFHIFVFEFLLKRYCGSDSNSFTFLAIRSFLTIGFLLFLSRFNIFRSLLNPISNLISVCKNR